MKFDRDEQCWVATVQPRAFKPTPVSVAGDKRKPLSLRLLVGIGNREVKAGNLNPTEAQTKAYQHLVDNEQVLFDRCLDAISTDGVPKLRAMIGPHVKPDVLEAMLPHPMTPELFKERARFDTLSVVFDEKQGVAHIEYFYHFDWDPRMSLKVVLHKDRLVYVGGGGDGWRDR